MLGESVDPTVSRPSEQAVPPAPLFPTSWLRRVVVWANAGSIPALFIGDAIGLALAALGIVSLIVWSGVSAMNVRRARPATRHGSPPHPAAVVASWFVAPVFGVAAIVAIVLVAAWAESGTFEEQGTRTMVLAVTVFVAAVGMLMAAYQPYRALARCAKWVYTDSGRFRKWFVAPIVGALISGVIQILAGLVALSDTGDRSSTVAVIGAVGLWVVSFTLPWLAWLISGSRAMRSLESGVAHAHDRTGREAHDPSEVVPLHAAPPAGVPAVSAPSV
ncbi:hypothetical protein [Ilumatobacter sp.]|uniref:hypothetical protein n=1 Tax=Ilumatobacter sp. TaxID=1967498 RepID=UPI003C76AEA1